MASLLLLPLLVIGTALESTKAITSQAHTEIANFTKIQSTTWKKSERFQGAWEIVEPKAKNDLYITPVLFTQSKNQSFKTLMYLVHSQKSCVYLSHIPSTLSFQTSSEIIGWKPNPASWENVLQQDPAQLFRIKVSSDQHASTPDKLLKILIELEISRSFAEQNYQVISPLAPQICAHEESTSKATAGNSPDLFLKAHLIVFMKGQLISNSDSLATSTPGSGTKFSLNPVTIQLHSALWNHKLTELKIPMSPQLPLNVQKTASDMTQVVKPYLDQFQEKWQVISREGRFVTINKGRAIGLKVGTRFVGIRQQKLHLIQYTGLHSKVDSAVLLIRSEDPSNPLKPGDSLQLDLESQDPVSQNP